MRVLEDARRDAARQGPELPEEAQDCWTLQIHAETQQMKPNERGSKEQKTKGKGALVAPEVPTRRAEKAGSEAADAML